MIAQRPISSQSCLPSGNEEALFSSIAAMIAAIIATMTLNNEFLVD
jgi:hypothetical protein